MFASGRCQSSATGTFSGRKEMIAGAYIMHLYCRFAPESEEALAKPDEHDARHREGAAEFGEQQTEAAARRHARKRGWVFGRDGDVTCPICVKHGPGITRP